MYITKSIYFPFDVTQHMRSMHITQTACCLAAGVCIEIPNLSCSLIVSPVGDKHITAI